MSRLADVRDETAERLRAILASTVCGCKPRTKCNIHAEVAVQDGYHLKRNSPLGIVNGPSPW